MSKSTIPLLMAGLLLSAWTPIKATASPEPEPKTIHIKKNAVMLGNKPGRLLYESKGDLDGDGRQEAVFSVMLGCNQFCTVIARPARSGWRVITVEASAYCFSRADAADVNGDGKLEIVVRTMSGDGHYICHMYNLEKNRLVAITPNNGDRFGLTRFADIDHDGRLEVLSITDPAFGFLGDFWLTIYKWDGMHCVDVSERFPAQYDKVIARIRRMIYRLQYTNYYGHPQSPDNNPAFGELYYNLGRAYELRRQPKKARTQYAIAHRLYPGADWIDDAFQRTWKPAKPSP